MEEFPSEVYDSNSVSENEEDALSTTDSTLRASVDNKHWVEELFPPAFGLTVDDILEDIGKAKDSEMGVFEKYARGIHPQDLSAIKNVYERVWLMATIEKQEQQKKAAQENESVGTLTASKLQERLTKTVKVRDAQTSTEGLEKYDIHDPCIWTDSEIGVLREVFQTARKQNRDLQVHLTEASQRLAHLEHEYKKQRTDIETKEKNLAEALKANTRLNILCKNLHKQLKTATSKNDAIVEEIGNLKVDRMRYLQDAHEAKVKLDKERLERKGVEMSLERQTKEAVREQMTKEEKVRSECERKVNAMERKMEEMKQELQEEKKAHARTKKGLEHLRTHFASLPFSGEASGMVVEDQLQKWTF